MANRTFKDNKWEHGLPINEQGSDEKNEHPIDNRPGGSFWQRAAVSTPIIAGVGVGIHRLIGRDIFPNINFQRTSFLDKFRANIQSFASDGALRVGEIKDRKESADPHLIKAAWEQALQSADPSKMIRRVPLDANDPLSSIEYFSKTNKSFQANKVIKNFIGQFKSLEKHAIATFTAPDEIKFSAIKAPKFSRRELGLNQIEDPILRESLTNIQKSISTIPEASMRLSMTSRKGVKGSQLMVTFTGGKFGTRGSSLELPMELSGPELRAGEREAGVIVHGTNQQTKRIVGKYGLVDKATNKITSTLNHEQFVARLFEQEMIPKLLSDNLKGSYEIHKTLNDFNRSTIEHGVWVNNLPAGMIVGHDARVSAGKNIVNLIDQNNLSRLDSEAAGHVLRDTSNKLFPSTSGNQLAKGIVSSKNAQDYWLAGRAFPFERQPMQGLRRGYGPSDRSRAARLSDPVRAQYSWMHTDEFDKEFGNYSDIMLKTIFVSEKKHPGFAEKALGGVAGGHSLVSKEVEDQLEHLDPLQIKLSKVGPTIKAQMDISQTHEGVYDFRFPVNMTPNEIIGYDSMGQAVHYDENMKILGARIHSDNNEDFIKLFGARITQPKHPKFFGGDKAVASQTPQGVMDRLLRRESNLAFEGAKYITSIDTLKKNRSLHNSQMLTALHEFTLQNMQQRGKNIENFHSVAQEILASAEGVFYNNENVIKNVLLKAKEAKFNPHQIGLTFGALPEIYGDDWRKALSEHNINFSSDEIAHIESGHAFGVSQLYYGGVPTSGGRGSVEPRFFETLKGPQYGGLGHKIIADISERQIISNPEIVMEQGLLEQSLGSIAHGTGKMQGVLDYHVKDMKPSIIEEIMQKGGRVDLGGTIDNSKSIYIPGADKSMFMRGFVTPEGETVSADLKYAYSNLLETASDVYHGTDKRRSGEIAMQKLVSELGTAHGKTITGKGTGLARSKVMGSLYATVLPGTVDELGGLNTIGVSKSDAMGMFNQLTRMYEHSSLPNKQTKILELEERRERILAGGLVGAITARDPNIGPYSAGVNMMKIIPGLEKGYVKVAQQTKVITDAEGKEVGRVALGPMAGKAGDYDEDNNHVMLSSSEIEKDIQGHFHVGNQLLSQEQEYIIRQQLLKAKAPPAQGLTLGEEMLAGAEKLAMSKEKVGPISSPFREIKAALTEAKLPSHEYLSAASLLEALENIPISGKHVPGDKIQQLREQMTRLGTAASRGKGFELADLATEVFGQGTLASNLLTQPQKLFMDGKELNLPALNINKSADTINKVMLDFKEKAHGVGNISEAAERAIISGKRMLEGHQIESHLAYDGGLLSEFKLVSKGLNASLSRAKSTVQNTLSSIGGQLMEHAGKPLAIGFGASLAIAAVLSKPISNLGPGDSAPPAAGITSANSDTVKPETLHPDSEVSGRPTTSSPIPGPTARIQDNSRPHINIRGINRNNSNMSVLSNAITSRLAGSSTVNVNIRDRKSSINQQALDKLIRR